MMPVCVLQPDSSRILIGRPSRPLGQITAGSLVTRPAAWAGESDADNAKVSRRTVARRARRIPVPRPGRHRTSPSWANYVPCSLCIEASRPLTMCISSRTGEPVLSKPWSTGLVAMALRPNLMAPACWDGVLGYHRLRGPDRQPAPVLGPRGGLNPKVRIYLADFAGQTRHPTKGLATGRGCTCWR